MEKIWAPWRMEYILHPKEDGCFLCDAFANDADREHLVLRRGKRCVVIMNRYPYNNAHLMVAPYRHVNSLTLLDAEELLEMMELVNLSMTTLRQVVSPHGFNIGVNEGEVAGAGLKDHVHAHIVPRWNGDTNFMPVLADTKVIPEALLELWDKLQGPFARE